MDRTTHTDTSNRTDPAAQSGGQDEARAPLLVRRDLQMLVRNGNSVTVTLQRPYLRHLGWLAGNEVIVELYEDNSVRVRRPTIDDIGPSVKKPIRLDLQLGVRA